MDQKRQEAFQKLRPPCVELSSVALKFKASQVAVKDVLQALQSQHRTLKDLSLKDLLDAKLAEYAFFPLTHIFNESKRLSSRCLEVAVQSVEVLVGHGWHRQLSPEMGKQLLILMSLLAGGDPNKQIAAPDDELKAAAIECIATVVKWLIPRSDIENQSTRSIVDQLTYLLAESLSESISDFVQLSANHALTELFSAISDRVFLASILPRTVSSLVKALRPSTQSRRTHKVICGNLSLLRLVLSKVLADITVVQAQKEETPESETLDQSWLKATSIQVRNALIHVTKLRNSDREDVRLALSELCIMVMEECSKSLQESVPVMLETLVILSGEDREASISASLKHLVVSRPDLAGMLRTGLYDWTQALPRVMQANDDGPKELILKKVTNAFDLLGENMEFNDNLINILSTTMLNSVANLVDQDRVKLAQISDRAEDSFLALTTPADTQSHILLPVILNHQSQQISTQQLRKWIQNIKIQPYSGKVTRILVDAVPAVDGSQKLAALWLAVQLLRRDESASFDFEDLILTDSSLDRSTSRSNLVYDVYSLIKDLLIESSPFPEQEQDWRLTALSLEVLTLQAQQMGKDYRNELYETLYPVLALFSSKNDTLQNNAVVTLNSLAAACQYDSAKAMLIENVDYLVNAIAWKLNTFALSSEAPRVLNMVIRLVGPRLIPYLDDLIASIFAALDSYHGYPVWVEMLFTVLKTMVDESAKQPTLAITETEQNQTSRRTRPNKPADILGIVGDLQARKKRKLIHHREDAFETDQPQPAPKRPWTREHDDPNYIPAPSEQDELSLESLLKQDEEGDLPAPSDDKTSTEDDPMKPKSKSHDLLLQIARATVPHLSSPSPRVRHLLLQLLLQILPLLSRHENTFLPLINTIWPAIVPRLFADQISGSSIELFDRDSSSPDTREFTYNIVAAANLVAVLCENAGDFMTTRVEQIFRQLIKMYTRTLDLVNTGRQTQQSKQSTSKSIQTNVSGTVELQFVRHQDLASSSGSTMATQNHNRNQTSPAQGNADHLATADQLADRTSQSQILTALISVLTDMLTHVSMSGDRADEIIDALTPFITARPTERVVSAVQKFNPDVLWLLQERGRIEGEIHDGLRETWDRVWKPTNRPESTNVSRTMEVVF